MSGFEILMEGFEPMSSLPTLLAIGTCIYSFVRSSFCYYDFNGGKRPNSQNQRRSSKLLNLIETFNSFQ